MNETLILMLALMAGLFLGALFFGGLWWTVQKAVFSQRPAVWLVSSLLLRMCIVLVGLYYVAGGHWQRLLACLVGIVIARFVVSRLVRLPVAPSDDSAKEVDHASQS